MSVSPDAVGRWPVDGPLDLGRTVRGVTFWGFATWLRVDRSGAWISRRTPEGPGTLRLTTGHGEVIGEAWGPGAHTVLEDVPGLAGLDDPGTAAIPVHSPLVKRLAHRDRGWRLARWPGVVETLMAISLGQKVTGINAQRGLFALVRRYGEPAPGPRQDLALLPDVDDILRLPAFAFHPLGIEGQRASLLRRIASRADALQRAFDLPPAEGRAALQKLRGIGPWTAGVVAGGILGDADAVPVGDYHLPNTVAWNLAGEPRADDARMLQLLEPYAGQRNRVVRLLMSRGRKPPKYGPHSDVRDIRGQ